MTDHDSDHPMDQTIFVMVAGAAVESCELAGHVSLVDIPATILWSLGVARPTSYAGRVLTDGFLEAMAAA